MQQLTDQLGLSATQAAGLLLAGVLLAAVVVWLRRRKRLAPVEPPVADRSIRVTELGEQGPPGAGPRLEFYHLPVRLAALVIAPTGRGNDAPPEDRLAAIVNQIVPGMGAVLEVQRPQVRIWPAQLSSQGFANTFFAQTLLPGDKGKGTPWCAVAGRFEADGQKYQAGLVLRAAAPSNLSHVVVERESQWMDLVRVRLTREA
jgi:hypothetical protein